MRSTIIEAAARLLQEHGSKAVTTRGVSQAAGVQAPLIYRLFGDKDGLLEAVAEHVLTTHVAAKAAVVDAAAASDVDPLDDLREGWETQLEFSLANPELFRLLTDPGRAVDSPAARLGRQVLERRVRRVALAGRLRVSEGRAVDLIQAAGEGVVLTLLAKPPAERDRSLPDAIYEAVLRAIVDDAPALPDSTPLRAAVAFRAHVPALDGLSDAERHLMVEWLERVTEDRWPE